MRFNRAFALLFMIILARAHALPAAELVQIDDLTAYDTRTGRFIDHPATIASSEAVSLTDGATPPLAAAPRALNDGYVGCSTSDDLTPFDLTTYQNGAVVSLLPEADYPYDATLSPDGSEVWIPGAVGDGVIVIDRATNAITHRIAAGEYTISVAFSDDGALALASNRDTRDITLIDTATHTVTGTLDLGLSSGFGPGNLALDPVSGNLYAVRWYDGELYEIAPDGAQVLRSRALGASLWQLVVDPDGQHLYVTDRATDQVLVIEQATLDVVGSFPVGDDPWGIDITGDGEFLIVACEDNSTVYRVDLTSSVVTPIPLAVGADPRDVDILDSGGLAFVPGGRVGTTDPIYVIDVAGGSVSAQFETGGTNANVIAVQAQMHSTSTALADPGWTLGAGAMVANHPNPFNPSTSVEFTLPAAAPVELAVYDTNGHRVITLARGAWQGGRHRVSWDGRDAAGRAVAGGVYFIRLEAAGQSRTAKAVLAR